MIRHERPFRVALAGNPNTGKTTLFNRLTGLRAKVGNYPGVTVEEHTATLVLPGGRRGTLGDVPGAYSLAARSEEERVALRAVAGLEPNERPDCVVCVVDATQLVRNLYLALQVIELSVPVVIALTMTDRLEESGQSVDTEALSRSLGVPVVPVVPTRGLGLEELRAAIARTLDAAPAEDAAPPWSSRNEALLTDLGEVGRALPETWHAGDRRRRDALALWALLSIDENDELTVPPDLREAALRRRAVAEGAGRELDLEIIRERYDWIEREAERFLVDDEPGRATLTDRIDRILLHPVLGFALFLLIMGVVFQSLFAWADPAIGVVEGAFAFLGEAAAAALPKAWWSDLVVEGVITGVGGVIVFLPQILLLFLFIGLMEDTGYMARVAYLMDRVMKTLGLHGRAFVPMLSGFACAIPAILATRTMERNRDRLLTMMVIPLMTCSARLPVYALLIAAIVPPGSSRPFAQGLLMVAMYLFSTVVALGAAAVLGRTVLRGPRIPFLLEMPPYRVPHVPTVLSGMWRKSWVFVREAGTVILACTIAMWALLSYPVDEEMEAGFDTRLAALEARAEAPSPDPVALDAERVALEDERASARLRHSYGGRLGMALEPVLAPLGFDWKIGVGILGAFAAREVFVSTLAVVYGLDADTDEASPTLREAVREERRPDGTRRFTPLVCFSLMVFFALACQCMSTLAVVKRETGGWRWPSFLFVYMTALAWVASFVVYQGGRWVGLE